MYSKVFTQKLPISLDKCWDFFTSPSNLKILTPDYLKIKMIEEDSQKMYAGQLIQYTVRPLFNIPLKWVTEITHVEEKVYFVDEQLFGPYKFWHHEHRFIPLQNGVEVIDRLHYKLPLGYIGNLMHYLIVEKDLQNVFAFREKKLLELFGKYTHEN